MKIGTCIRGNHIKEDLKNAISMGFDTVELYYNESLAGTDLEELSKQITEEIGDSGIKVAGIGLYCNPLQDNNAKAELLQCIEKAQLFGTDFVGTFAGAISGKSVDDSMPEFKRIFSELVKAAEFHGVKIGIENAHMYGHWYSTTCNIGFCPKAWEMMFHEVDSKNLGLEWEPAHQIEQLIDPISQLKQWLPKIFHVHGKDAKIDNALVKKYGIWFGSHYCDHRFPGLGDSDWREIISLLKNGNYSGDISIEGYHDPEYSGDTELKGQELALQYLRNCMK